MAHGCYLCHVPHTTGTNQAAGGGVSITGAVFNTTTGTGKVQGAGVGLPNGGAIYLWGQALSPIVYTTWDGSGGTITGTGITTPANPAVHSIMCLSCHDGAVSGSSYDTMTKPGGPSGTGATAQFGPGNTGGVAGTFYTGNTANNGWASSGSLLTNHPVHALYPVKGTDNHYGQYWGVTITAGTAGAAGTVSFTDSSFVPYTGSTFTGHPAKLYTDGTFAYVECTSCHEPHRFGHVAYQTNGSSGTWQVDTGTTPTTTDYIRGPYNLPTGGGNEVANGNQNAGFCRSCHYEKSANYMTYTGGTVP
jgi:hypothetical protein